MEEIFKSTYRHEGRSIPITQICPSQVFTTKKEAEKFCGDYLGTYLGTYL